jgi:hypothetical protein
LFEAIAICVTMIAVSDKVCARERMASEVHGRTLPG